MAVIWARRGRRDDSGRGGLRIGRKLEATFQWAHARDMKPDKDVMASVQKKLMEGLPPLEAALVPFPRSVAATVVSMQEPSTMNNLAQLGASGTLELQPFEKNRRSLLAAPLAVAPGIHVVLELFDKGTFDVWERLTAETPETVLDLMEINGIGPKTAKLLHEQFKVSSLPELKDFIESGGLDRVDGIGPKTAAKIKEAVSSVEPS